MAGFLHIAVVIGRILVSRVVGILHQRQSCAVMHLRAQHEGQLLPGQFRIQVHNALDILHCIPVSVSVPLAAVN